MSYARLILDGDDAKPAVAEFLDQVILFVVHRRAAQAHDRRHVVDGLAIFLLDEVAVAGFFDALGDAAHRPIERALFPSVRVRRAVEHLGDAVRIDRELKRVRALRAERAFVDGAFVVAFDVDDLAAFDVDHLAAADRAVRADAWDGDRAANARGLGERVGADRLALDGR